MAASEKGHEVGVCSGAAEAVFIPAWQAVRRSRDGCSMILMRFNVGGGIASDGDMLVTWCERRKEQN